MTREEKKEYIMKNWKIAPGRKISEMLLRYWNVKKSEQKDLVAEAKEIFEIK